MNIIILSDYILEARIITLIKNLDNRNYSRFNHILVKTIYNIKNYEVCYVNYFNLQAYLRKLEIAQLLCFCECYDAVRVQLNNALRLIKTNFGKMKDCYMMINRLKKYNNNTDFIGNLIILSNDIIVQELITRIKVF